MQRKEGHRRYYLALPERALACIVAVGRIYKAGKRPKVRFQRCRNPTTAGGVYAYVGSHPEVMQRETQNKSERPRDVSDHWKPLMLLAKRREASWPQVGARYCGRLDIRIYLYIEVGACRTPFSVYKGKPKKRKAR